MRYAQSSNAVGPREAARLNWKTKALIQRACAALPFGSQAAYYRIQKAFGGFRKAPDPLEKLHLLRDVLDDLAALDFRIEGKRILEVGTGWRADIPMLFYLLGAVRVDTFDLNRYLRAELMLPSVTRLTEAEDQVVSMLRDYADPNAIRQRLARLRTVSTLDQFLQTTGIVYHAPADATNTGLPAGSVDLHFSYTVFEHIPGPEIVRILLEANRLLDPAHGVSCHHIDFSDHFSHSDPSISAVNFLQFEPETWSRLSNAPWAYHNRLRIYDFQVIYEEARQRILSWKASPDPRCLELLQSGALHLATPFQGKPPDQLAVLGVRAISRAR